MAERRGFIREIILRLNRDAARQVQEETQEALDAAGQAGAAALEEAMQAGGNKAVRALTRELSRGYNQTIAEARVKFAQGLIPASEFQRIRAEAAATFDRGLIAGMERLQAEGKLTENQFVRLSRRLKGVGRDGPREVGRVSTAVDRLRGLALRTAGVLAGLFALHRIRQFGAEARRAGEAAEAGQRQLIQTLDNVGVAWASVRGQIEATAASLWRTHRLTGGEVDDTLRELVKTTGDYALSLEHVGLAADVAAATGSSLEKAAQRVGRVLQGDIGWMKRFGWAAEDSADAIRILQERTAGMAAAGVTGHELLAKVMGDLKEEIGLTIVEAERGASVYDTITASVRRLTDWVRTHRGDISAFLQAAIEGLGQLVERVHALTKALLVAGAVVALNRLRAGIMAANTAAITFRATLQGMYALLGPKGWLIIGVAALTEAFHRSGRRAREAKAEIDGYFASLRAMTVEELTAEISALSEQRREIQAQIDRTSAGPRRDALLRNLETVKEAGRLAIQLRNELIRAAREPAEVATQTAAELSADALAKEITALTRGHELRVLTTSEMARALELERETAARLRDGTLSLEDRITAMQQLQQLQRITPGARGGLADSIGTPEAPTPERVRDPRAEALGEVARTARSWVDDFGAAAEGVAYGVAGSFQDMFGVLLEGFDNVGEAAEAMARGMGGALLGGVAEYASAKVKENVAAAVEALALGLAYSGNPLLSSRAPAMFQAAKTHGLAAAKWAVLAGASGAGQAAIAGGGRGGLSGGIPTGARDTTGRLLEDRSGPEVHIYIDPLDPSRPAYQRNVYAAQRFAQQRYGDGATVHVHPHTGGGQ